MFWDWLNNENGHGGPDWKQVTTMIVVFFVVPFLIYWLLKWDPIIGFDEEGEPTRLGVIVILLGYWAAAYFHASRHYAKKRLNKLIDKLMDKEQADTVVKKAQKKQSQIEDGKYVREEDNDRVKWFGID